MRTPTRMHYSHKKTVRLDRTCGIVKLSVAIIRILFLIHLESSIQTYLILETVVCFEKKKNYLIAFNSEYTRLLIKIFVIITGWSTAHFIIITNRDSVGFFLQE